MHNDVIVMKNDQRKWFDGIFVCFSLANNKENAQTKENPDCNLNVEIPQ